MRRFVFIVLMLLVPLRVLAAESVGICMMEAKAAAHEQADDSMPPDCPDHKQQPAGATCDSCQMCMPLAGPDDLVVATASRPESSPLASPFAHFSSADAHPILKPPIA